MSKVRNIILSIILSFCMVAASLPVELLAQEAVEAEETEIVRESEEDDEAETVQESEDADEVDTVPGVEESTEKDETQYVIVSFEELPEDVVWQNVAIGTSVEDLQLPDSLTASYISRTEKSEEGNKQEKEEPEDDDGDDSETENGEENPEDETGDGSDADTGEDGHEGEAENEPETKSGEEEPEDETGNASGTEPSEEGPEDEVGNASETVSDEEGPESEIGNVSETETGESETGSNPKTESNESEIKNEEKSPSAAETVQKTVTVHMKEYRSEPDNMMEKVTLSAQDEEHEFDNASEEITETVHTILLEGITWACTPEYDGELEGTYVFTPVLPEEYILGEGVELPEIIVTVEEVEETYLSEANSDLSDEEPELARISTNTKWGDTTLTSGRVIVEPNITLTLTGTVTISGKVTFEGGGYITRGSVDGYFYMDSADASLTMRDITVNGNSYNFKAEGGTEYTFIVKNGILILDDYCKITNCDTYRPIVSLSDGELIVNKAKISNSSVMSGGIISVSRSTAKINGAEITDCRSRGTIGAISISSGTAKLNGVKITNCTASSSGGAINIFNSEVEIKGSEITNCRSYNMGGAIYMNYGGTLDVWDTTIADCKASFYGGAFDVVSDSTLKIHSGTYRNNSTVSTTDLVSYGGGCIRNINSKVYIYGGDFIENTSPIKGGCIYHAGSNSITYLYGGYFKGNTCETCEIEEYKGSGAVFNGARNVGETYLYISGDVQFVGDEEYGFGADGIYLDQNEENGVARKIWIIDPLKSRINIYVKAKEGYVIAEGSDYTITDSDRNKMNVINVGDDAGPWYKVLDEEKNQVYLTKIKNTATYTVEHYQQNLDESGYTIVESYTQELEGTIGETVTATPISYPGFTENTDYESRIASGEVTEDGDLVLRLYYDRNIYNIYFVLNYGNSGSEEPFETQTVRFGNKLNEVTEPSRRGYSFKGWYINSEGTGNRWNFNDKVEDITAERNIKEQSATLYAKWVDDIAPVLGATSYNIGYKDLGKWIVRKKDLVITVPITEEGSGIDKVEYTLTPENGDVISGEVQYASAYAPRQIRTDSILQLDVENGQTVARITISEDYEGTVSLRCADKAENSTGKLLTANDGGIIVEDNAPQIDVTVQDEKDSKRVVDVAVSDILISNESVPDDADPIGNGNYIISGIADINYRIDNNTEQTVSPQNYNNPQYASEDKDSMLLSCEFSIDISGSGEHSLYISATDNAGNVSSKTTTVSITEPKTEEKPQANNKKPKKKTKFSNTQTGTATYIEETTDVFTPFVQLANPQPPKDTEPQTGDTSKRVEIYATMAMIAGMFYILLYFCTGKNGMTEEEKNEFISKILAWAKRGSRIRKPIAIAVIFWVLFYYHSIGKRVQVEWDEVYVK